LTKSRSSSCLTSRTFVWASLQTFLVKVDKIDIVIIVWSLMTKPLKFESTSALDRAQQSAHKFRRHSQPGLFELIATRLGFSHFHLPQCFLDWFKKIKWSNLKFSKIVRFDKIAENSRQKRMATFQRTIWPPFGLRQTIRENHHQNA
jgi:hypothetical protein